MKFIQHVPNFVSGCKPEVYEFDTLDELLECPYFKRVQDENFYRFSMAKDKHPERIWVMHEFWKINDNKPGCSWWVMGYVDEMIDLPEWNAEECVARVRGENSSIGYSSKPIIC